MENYSDNNKEPIQYKRVKVNNRSDLNQKGEALAAQSYNDKKFKQK